MTDLDMYRWCYDRATRFRVWENREMAYFPDQKSRDVAIVEWVIRCLGNPEFESGSEVLELLRRQRESATTAAGGAEGDQSNGGSNA